MIGNVRIKGSGHTTFNTRNTCIDKHTCDQVSVITFINVIADGVNVTCLKMVDRYLA